jgi:hypothetical protein
MAGIGGSFVSQGIEFSMVRRRSILPEILEPLRTQAEVNHPDGFPPWGTSLVTIRGLLGPAGHLGSLDGACMHELVVLEILKVGKKTWR